MSLSSLDVLLDRLVHPPLSIELDCFFLPLEERDEGGVEEVDSCCSHDGSLYRESLMSRTSLYPLDV